MRPPPYSAIVDRPPLRWPGGARVAVWPMLATAHPEVANWAWRDYGNRVGVWRLFDHLALTGRLPGPELARAVIDHFDQLWRDGETHGRSMAIGIHSFISGQALRTRYVREYLEHMKARGEVWLTTSDAIYDWMASPSVP